MSGKCFSPGWATQYTRPTMNRLRATGFRGPVMEAIEMKQELIRLDDIFFDRLTREDICSRPGRGPRFGTPSPRPDGGRLLISGIQPDPTGLEHNGS